MSFLERCWYRATLLCIVSSIAAYQFDVDDLIVYENPVKDKNNRENYFGYSVALWRDSKKSWVLIGAPRANSSAYKSVYEPGTVYKCDIGEPCKEWIVENNSRTAPQNGSWLGGSIAVGEFRTGVTAMVCGPRWRDTTEPLNMRGMCYQAKDLSNQEPEMAEAVEPLHKAKAPAVNGDTMLFAMGECGFSIHMVPKQPSLKVVLGVPGTLVWQGTPIISRLGDFNIPNPYFDKSVDSNTYSGYAVTSGLYFGSSQRKYVTGAPRAHDCRGQVVVFEFPRFGSSTDEGRGLKWNKVKIIGDQVGEYFGSALATCDINGDGRDDLLVGAPHWSKETDEGRIYVFTGGSIKNRVDNFADRKAIDGKNVGGRFGSAITCLGDVDFDGFKDVAVGAPYDGNGTVHIYHGSKVGLRHTQTIFAPNNTKGFGFSISEPKDIDGNGYADIAVGAYRSGHVILFRSKRVVNMTVTLSIVGSQEPLKWHAESFLVKICSSYEGRYAPNELPVSITLKIKDLPLRAIIDKNHLSEYEFNETLTLDRSTCNPIKISINKNNADFLNPLKLVVTQRLNTYKEKGLRLAKQNNTLANDQFHNLAVTTHKAHAEVQNDLDVQFAVDCGNQHVCNSSLSIRMATDLTDASKFIIGSGQIVRLNITVANTGDEAYRTRAILYIPHYIRLSSRPITCDEAEEDDRTQVMCFIANPLGRSETRYLDLGLDMNLVPSTTEQIILYAEVTTQSNNVAAENYSTSQIDCVAETDIGIAGNTEMDYQYSLKGNKEDLLDISFQHTFEIKNYEVTPIAGAIVSVSFPTHWIDGSEEIEVIRLNKSTGYLDDREFYCSVTQENTDLTTSSSILQKDKNLFINQGKTFAASIDNRTLHLNCSNPAFNWTTIDCEMDKFETAQSTAKLVLQFDLLLKNLTPAIIEKKDFIFFVSNATTRLLYNITQSINNRSDSIVMGTLFIESSVGDALPVWLIPTSVSVGVLLLIIVILGLAKLGFFRRTEKVKLEKLRNESDLMSPVILIETTSSTEALDRN